MTRQRVTRLANPRRKTRTRSSTPRKRATVRKRRRNGVGTRNRKGQFVKASKVRTRKAVKRRTRRANPVLVTLGAVNPRPIKRRKTKVARRRRRNSTVTRRRRRRANPVAAAPRRRRRTVRAVRRRRRRSNPVVVVTRRRRRNTYRSHRRRNGRRSYRRRNPSVFGRSVASVGAIEMVTGGLIGVAAAKLIPTYLPAQFLGTPVMRIIATGASAYVASMAVGKIRPHMADAVFFGGLMQTFSVLLNTFLPSIGSQIGLSGYGRDMGDFVAGQFAVPQNPIVFPQPPAPAQARIPMNGLSRAFGTAF